MNATQVAEVWAVPSDPKVAEKQLARLLRRARQEDLRVSIAGARHSMGGHTLYPGGISIDMLPFDEMQLDGQKDVLHVQAGALWKAIYSFMQARLEPGDQIVVSSPLFHPLHAIARHRGCKIREWRATDELSCSFDVSDLASICDEKTKLVVLNFPHNPTGQTVSESDFLRIVEIAKSVDAMLFSDEAFRLLELPPNHTLPAACEHYDKAISVTGLSKPFGLGGLRIGWMVTKCDEIRTAVKQYRYNTAEMTNTPCQWLACRALRRADEVLTRNRALISANLDRLDTFVKSHEGTLKLFRPKAGTMAVVEQRTSLASSEFCQRILDEERLFLVPGKALGMSDRLLRFGLGITDFAQGLERLDRFLQRPGVAG